MPRYRAICDHWERTPPLSVSAWVIAQSLGAKPAAKRARKPDVVPDAERAGNRQALIDMFGGTPGMGLAKGKPEWLTTPM